MLDNMEDTKVLENDSKTVSVQEEGESLDHVTVDDRMPMRDKAVIIPSAEENTSEATIMVSQEELDNMSPEKKVSILKSYSEVIDVAAKQNTVNREITQVWGQRDKMRDMIKSPDPSIDPIALLDKKMKQVKDTQDLIKNYLPFPEKVKWLMTDDDTGMELDMVPEGINEKQIDQFTKDFLIFYKQCDDSIAEYDKISKEANEELEAINADINEISRVMSNNVLAFIESLKESTSPDSPEYDVVQQTIRGVQSAYDFKLIFDTLEKHPSIIKNTLSDFRKDLFITNIGRKYAENLRKTRTTVNLITFLPKSDKTKSIEDDVIPKFYRPGTKDLLIFIFVRYFSTNGALETVEGKKFHAALYHMLYQLTNNQLSDVTRDYVIENIKKLLQLYYDQIPSWWD